MLVFVVNLRPSDLWVELRSIYQFQDKECEVG